MTYLFTNDQEIKNEVGNPITTKIVNGTTPVSLSNPLPVTLGSGSITITGNVNVGTTVSVTSTPESPVHTHLTEVGTSGILTTPYLPVAGTVEITNDVGNPIPISKNTSVNGVENPLAVEWAYNSGATIIPWEIQVGRGKIPGITGLSIAGYQAAVPTEWVPIWEYPRAYVYPTVAEPLRVWSSSALDTNLSVLISGLDANYSPISETVVLTNGLTGVLTTQSFFRVNNISLTRLPMNIGNVSIGNSSRTNELCTIQPDCGRSQMTIYTVPAGYTFFLSQVNVLTNQTGSQTALFRSYTRSVNGVTNTILTFPFTTIYNSVKIVTRPYAEKTDIQWQVQSSQGTSRIGGQIEGYLISNTAT
ncbi:hypothetical protein UFOVP58_62 [uncultured Caudovirales phage]|uniref:Uncharacterized protein n=1 Tax=uncultured Caudovirales phage TaxID=2100421 RepID=A0A6J5KYS5_9CAUD|nr:hypothetical protein UFOVP58_62 [uncultured Caudovirales phage]